MPWWKRLSNWLLRRRPRLVRLHLRGEDPSIEGFLLGRWDGHYVLAIAKLHHDVDTAVLLDGDVMVPIGNVLFLQRLVAVAS